MPLDFPPGTWYNKSTDGAPARPLICFFGEVLSVSACEECLYYGYDEEADEYVCSVDMDMDEAARFLFGSRMDCPFYTPGDEYSIVRKQN